MNPDEPRPPAVPVVLCAKHKVPLEKAKAEVTYQGHTFAVDTFRCPVCGQVLIPEELAKGRMLEVEQTLEEK